MKPRPGLIPAAATLLAAVGWLLSRVFVGLDFTDEMQYYGEIASLTRTGKFFQNDLFIQQLGYVLLFPVFKLHALLFPDQSYLVLVGRMLMLAGYAAVGALFWRTALKRTDFSAPARLAGLAMFVAWIPFQLLSPSYNSMACLLMVAVLALWLGHEQSRPFRTIIATAALLAALTFTYPPAGIVLTTLLVVDLWRRDRSQALQLAGLTGLGGVIVGGAIVGLHGLDFFRDLATALTFSRAFAGHAVLEPQQLASLVALVAASWLFVRRAAAGRTFRTPFNAGNAAIQWAALAVFVVAGAALLRLGERWVPDLEFFPIAGFALLLIVFAVSIAPDTAHASPSGENRSAPSHGVMIVALAAGCAALLFTTARWGTGYLAAAVHAALLALLAPWIPRGDGRPLAELAFVGAVLGAVVAVTSGNGVHNFGVGAAVTTPFLALHAARCFERAGAGGSSTIARTVAVPLLVMILLFNGAWNPYREQRGWSGFERVHDVPAFKGVWTSPPKLEALQLFGQLAPPGTLAGKRVLVAGPQPWFYFASGGRPATPMFYMYFTGGPRVDEFLAQRLFRDGEPDVILVPNPLPLPLHAPLARWIAGGAASQSITLPAGFIPRYRRLTRYEISDEVLLLRRQPNKP